MYRSKSRAKHRPLMYLLLSGMIFVLLPLGVLIGGIWFMSFAISSQLGDHVPDYSHLLSPDAEGSNLAWSDDSRILVFRHDHNLYSVRADGRGVKVVAGGLAEDRRDTAASPSISAGESRLAYTTFSRKGWAPWVKKYGWEVVVSNLDGSSKLRLTHTSNDRSDLSNIHPSWSPSGAHIAFLSDRMALDNLDKGIFPGHFRLFVMAADGSGVRNIAPTIRVEAVPPSWSPDGHHLAFVGFEGESSKTPPLLYIVGVDGSTPIGLGEVIGRPTWSPEGDQIAFLRLTDGFPSVYVTSPSRPDTSLIAKVSPGHHRALEGLSWSPDGTQILLWGIGIVASIKSDGSDFRILAQIPVHDLVHPPRLQGSWSLDGATLAVHASITEAQVANGFDVVLFTMNRDGSDKRILTRMDLGLRYSSDGQLVDGLHASWHWTSRTRSGVSPGVTLDPPESRSPTLSSRRKNQSGDEAQSPAACATGPKSTCEPRDVSMIELFGGFSNSAAYGHGDQASVEEVLEKGLLSMDVSPVHIAVRGTADASTIRCQWLGTARTLEYREDAIRFWLGMDDTDPLPTASEVEANFKSYIDQMSPFYRDFVTASFNPIAHGGLSQDLLSLTCFADFQVHEYLVGDGPTNVNVAYDQLDDMRSFELYSRSHAAGEFGPQASTPLLLEGEYQDLLATRATDAANRLADAVGGFQTVLFLAPMGSHGNIAVEVWQVVAQWDLQSDDLGVVHAVRLGASETDPERTQTLTNLEGRIDSAVSSDGHAGSRIQNMDGLSGYYQTIGAHDDITPDDDDTTTFTPAQPPLALTCASGTAVTGPEDNRPLVHDCEVLVDNEGALSGTATLNWSVDTSIDSWDGVVTGGTPTRITELDLPSNSLTGSIPAELGTLSGLTVLDLSGNQLTGEIPHEIGWLFNLTEIGVTVQS